MRRKVLFALVLLVQASGLAMAGDGINELYQRRAEVKKKVDELNKELADLDTRLRGEFLDLQKKLADDGILGPIPVPPAPPPKPVDPLKAKLRAAYESDKGTRDDLVKLVAVYKAAVGHARNADVQSTKELLGQIREVAAEFLPDAEVLKGVRRLVAEELVGAVGPPSDVPITEAQREAAAKLFTQLVAILETL